MLIEYQLLHLYQVFYSDTLITPRKRCEKVNENFDILLLTRMVSTIFRVFNELRYISNKFQPSLSYSLSDKYIWEKYESIYFLTSYVSAW